jgi:hypothetical protein
LQEVYVEFRRFIAHSGKVRAPLADAADGHQRCRLRILNEWCRFLDSPASR